MFGGLINLWEVPQLTRQPRPPRDFFVELAHPRVPLSLQTNTNKQRQQRGSRAKTADGAICMACHSPPNIRLNDDRARLLDLRQPQEVTLLFHTPGRQFIANIWSLHLKQAPCCKSLIHYSCMWIKKRDPLAQVFLQNTVGKCHHAYFKTQSHEREPASVYGFARSMIQIVFCFNNPGAAARQQILVELLRW